MIYNIKQAHLSAFRFEWHPEIKRVYVIRLGVVPEVGDPIAFDIENQGAAINAVLIWGRGYRTRQAETALRPTG